MTKMDEYDYSSILEYTWKNLYTGDDVYTVENMDGSVYDVCETEKEATREMRSCFREATTTVSCTTDGTGTKGSTRSIGT